VETFRQIDLWILHACNALAWKSLAFDRCVVMLESNSFVKTGLLVALLWYGWFMSRDQPATRRKVIRTILGACLAVVIGRVWQRFLPQIRRPILDPSLHLRAPYTMDHRDYEEWGTLPSDHAVLLSALATGLWTISRWFGLLAFAWSVVVVFFVRIYTGLHYPSDILVGGMLGILIGWLVAREGRITPRFVDALLSYEAARPALFYCAAFLLTWQIADLFGGTRALFGTVWRASTNP
jgi:membrane-associated phospholipid phosphatase